MAARRLQVLQAPAGPDVGSCLAQLARALDGAGPALLLRPPDGPTPAGGEPALDPPDDCPDDPTAVAVATSGSTGAAKVTLLSRSALVASVQGTAQRLGGHGTWLLALPVHHVAGLQVLVRSLLAGTSPRVLDLSAGFQAEAFAAAATTMPTGPRYTSLVPTQLTRLLGDPAGTAALRHLDAVLVGGAASSPALLKRARQAGVQAVTTYGMSETCGGCVYDGLPLSGVGVRVDDAGLVRISGPVLARGYLGDPQRTAATFGHGLDGQRELRTDDLGEIAPDGGLRVLGRADDVIVTGGLKVSPAAVERVLVELSTVAEVVVVGVADPVWGQAVAAVIVPAGPELPVLATLRGHVAARLAPHAAPQRLVVVDRLPLRGPGKPDRAAAASLAADPSAP